MRGRTFLLIGLTVGLSAVPVCCNTHRRSPYDWNLVPVAVAARDLPAGAVVTYADLTPSAVPEQFVTASVVKPSSVSGVVNQVLAVPVQRGDAFRWSDFGRERRALEPQTRLVSIDLEQTDHFDVLQTLVDPVTRERIAETLVENAVVVSVTQRAAPALTTVQLVVPQERANVVLLAPEFGRLALSLRNRRDEETQESPSRATQWTLLAGTGHPRFSSRRPLALIRDGAK